MTQSTYSYRSVLLYAFIFFSPLISDPLHFTKAQTIYFTAFAYLIGAILLLFLNQQHRERNRIEKKHSNTSLLAIIKWGILGTFLAFATQIMANQLEQVIFQTAPTSANTLLIVEIVKQFPIYLVAVSIAGPIMEELVFRRALIGLFSQYMAPLLAATISSLLFAVAHFDGHLLIYFSMGIVFYFLYQKTGSIWTSIIAHCSMNFSVMVLQLLLQDLLP